MLYLFITGPLFWWIWFHKGLQELILSATNKQDLAERLNIWFIEMRAGVYTGGSQGLPQASPTPLIHMKVAAGTLAFTQDYMDYITQKLHTYITQVHELHPEMNKHLGLQYALGG